MIWNQDNNVLNPDPRDISPYSEEVIKLQLNHLGRQGIRQKKPLASEVSARPCEKESKNEANQAFLDAVELGLYTGE